MMRFLIGAAILALVTCGAESASARGHHRGNYYVASRPSHYHATPRHFYYYRGKHSYFWNQRYWYPSYGCYLYWDPGYSCYYYWCDPDGCYYPINYCPYGRYAW